MGVKKSQVGVEQTKVIIGIQLKGAVGQISTIAAMEHLNVLLLIYKQVYVVYIRFNKTKILN